MYTSLLFTAATLENAISHRSVRSIKRLAIFISIIAASMYILRGSDLALAACFFAFSVAGALFMWVRFVTYFTKTSPPFAPDPAREPSDLLQCLDLSAAQILSKNAAITQREALAALFVSEARVFFIKRLELDPEKLKNVIKEPADGADSGHSLLSSAASVAINNGHIKITLGDILVAAVSLSQSMKRFFVQEGIQLKDLEYAALWYETIKKHERPSFIERLEHTPGIGREWAYAFTKTLNHFARKISFSQQGFGALHALIHKHEIRLLEEALAQSAAANALVIGEPGVGKMTIVRGFAERIARGESFSNLNYKRIVQLNLEQVFGQASLGETIGLISRIFREAERAGNVIIVIDDIENYLSTHSKTNLSEILIPFLKSTAVKIIGLTDRTGFGRGAVENPELYNLFEKIEIEEANEERVMKILVDIAIHKERLGIPFVTYQALKKIYELSAQYITDRPFPEKALDLFEDTAVYVRSIGEKRSVRPEHVEAILERRLKLPIGELEEGESEKLVRMEEELHKRVIDQVEGIGAIADAMRRSRTGLSSGKKPIGSFLFLGPTGVGKTETAKALAEIYYGNEERMIRFDMSEYQKTTDLPRLIGSPEMKEPGLMANAVRENPLSLVLLDEIEKAHPNILNLFLQVLDEGFCTDAFGKRVDFRNSIIIGTSNAGAEFIRNALTREMAYSELQRALVDTVLKEGIFKPEFLNRFDRVVVFKPLSVDDTVKIATLLLKKLGSRIEQQGYGFRISEETPRKLAEAVAGSVFGARELRRLIQDSIESKLAKEILSQKYKKGDTITL